MPFSSRHALVFEEETGKVLFEKDANAVVPIASLTKLMTAMVVLDAKLDMNETINIDESDVDMLKHSSSRVPVGVSLSRRTVLQLALMSSDNRAAHALARTFPGGHEAFVAAVQQKLKALGMNDTVIEEPTGLSPHNRSTAADLVKMATAASHYPEISEITTSSAQAIDINGRLTEYRNTNRLVGRDGWDILLSKTGFTNEAGRCLIMRMEAAGKHVILVLLNASAGATRMMDAENVHRYLSGMPMLATRVVARPASHRHSARAARQVLVKHTPKARKKTRTA